jgi:hypothetical protein
MTKKKDKQNKAEQVSAEIVTPKMHGRIVCWEPGSGVTYRALLRALSGNGFDEKAALEVKPKQAFERAKKVLDDSRVIALVEEDDEVAIFQFTKEKLESHELHYTREAFVKLNKRTGDVECPDKRLQDEAQREVDACVEKRTGADVTKVIQKLIDKESVDIFPIRPQGGAYFVPEHFSAFMGRLDALLRDIGGSLRTFPVPAGGEGDRSVAEVVSEGMNLLVEEHQDAITQLKDSASVTITEGLSKKITQTRVKVEAYACYLQGEADRLKDLLSEAEDALKERVEEIVAYREENPGSVNGGARQYIFGHPYSSVCRWMGARGWKAKEAKKVVRHYLGEDFSEVTVQQQVGGGRRGERGYVPELTSQQEGELEDLRGE